jgi:hypothetical protein
MSSSLSLCRHGRRVRRHQRCSCRCSIDRFGASRVDQPHQPIVSRQSTHTSLLVPSACRSSVCMRSLVPLACVCLTLSRTASVPARRLRHCDFAVLRLPLSASSPHPRRSCTACSRDGRMCMCAESSEVGLTSSCARRDARRGDASRRVRRSPLEHRHGRFTTTRDALIHHRTHATRRLGGGWRHAREENTHRMWSR